MKSPKYQRNGSSTLPKKGSAQHKGKTMIKGRIINRDVIYRVRKVKREFGVRQTKNFTVLSFGKRVVYVSRGRFVFHNLQAVVSNPHRDYVVHACRH